MDVRSAYNSGLAGLQNASAQLNSASSQIARAGTGEETQQKTPESLSAPLERSPVSLTTELVNLKVAEFQAKSSSKVISTADDMIGTLINTSV